MWTRGVIMILMMALALGHVLPVYAKSEAEIEAERARLKAEIVQKEIEIQQDRIKLMNQKKETAGYQEAVRLLEAKMRAAERTIAERQRSIRNLERDIKKKALTIAELDEKLSREKVSLAKLIRKQRELDDVSLVEFVLSGKTLSEVFSDADRFDTIKNALYSSMEEVTHSQQVLLEEKERLAEARGDQEELKMIQEMQRREVAQDKREKAKLVARAKSKERTYQQTIKEKEKTVAQIRARLFALRDSNTGDVSFGTMLKYAQEASKKTGVSPALILAILTVETNLGKELGVGKWNEDMHPTRDVPIFLEITKELGLDPDKMPVSARPCSAAARRAAGPGKRCGYGYGGAMGPAQFIPSTWVLYKKRIARLSGQNPPNPWDPRTAVFATALLMMDNGADAGTRYAEHRAAVRYLAGWRNAEKKEYWWYGDRTMRYRDKYAADIKALGY